MTEFSFLVDYPFKQLIMQILYYGIFNYQIFFFTNLNLKIDSSKRNKGFEYWSLTLKPVSQTTLPAGL